jgi:hypothetical protein
MLESCGSRKLPYLRLDQTEIVPKTIKPGASIRYRLSYTACISQQTLYIPARLVTKILFKGKAENVRSDDSYSIKTGKWIVDTHIVVPKDARTGVYVLEATLSTKDGRLQDYVSFNVEP